MNNQIGMTGISFIEMASPRPLEMAKTLLGLGFKSLGFLTGRQIEVFVQSRIRILLNQETTGFAAQFASTHGPSICAMGWSFKNPKASFETAITRGGSEAMTKSLNLPAVSGIGGSLVYFIDDADKYSLSCLKPATPITEDANPGVGFSEIDHLTNNVYQGDLGKWSDFYKRVFEFKDVRTFDIHGEKTGLKSYALRSPDGSFCIPINEGTEAKSQINEYLEEYKGPGIQHLAFLTKNLLKSLEGLEKSGIDTLDISPGYYNTAFERTPLLKESKTEIQKRNVLVDGDEKGYLLQIFTKNLFGPIFIEFIQRENHLSFGEGNFKSLFDSIERDQMKRGYL